MKLPGGKRKYIAGSVGDPFEACEQKFRLAIEEIRKGTRIDPSNQTLAEYILLWLEERRIALKKGTYPRWRNFIEVHVVPDLGLVKLQKLGREDIQAWIARLLKLGLVPGTIRLYHRILEAALKSAVKRKLIISNPCEDVTLPRMTLEEMKFLDPGQARALLAFLKQSRHPRSALIVVAMTTGMRRGELQALRWEDINFKEEVVIVRRTVTHIPHEGYHESEPKTKGSRRQIPLTHEAVQALQALYEQTEAHKGLVFRGRFGSYFSPKGIGYMWEHVLIDAGLPKIRFHDLRHTAATLLLRAGASLKSVQKILGHSDVTTTMKYIHLLPEMLSEDVSRLSALLAA